MSDFDEFDRGDASAFSRIFAALDKSGRFEKRKPVMSAALALGMIAVLAVILWYTYPREARRQELANVPLVRAASEPIKVAPDDPGGMEIPYRDSTVFDSLRGEPQGQPEVENLLEETERPIPREQLFAGLKTEIEGAAVDARVTEDLTHEDEAMAAAPAAPDRDEDEAAPAAATQPAQEADLPAAEQAPVAVVSAKPLPVPVVKPQAKKEEAQTAPVPAKSEAAPVAGYYLQLGSVTSEAAAEKEWSRLQDQFVAQLKPLNHRIERADLGAKGIYFRIHGGPLGESDARAACSAINAKKAGGCLVVKR